MKSMAKYLWVISMLTLQSSCKREEPEVCPGGCHPQEFNLIDTDPAFSPEGTQVAYFHAGGVDDSGIYIINSDGTQNRLWHKSTSASAPSWSGDGGWIAFSEGGQIVKKKINGDSLSTLTNEGRNFFPTWSPNGQWIGYDSNAQSPNGMNFIWKINDYSLEKTRIAYDPGNGEIRMPFWGGNNTIVHIRYVSTGTDHAEIFTMREDGSQVVRLTQNNQDESYPKYSKNHKILYNAKPTNSFPSIWMMDADGKNSRQLTNHPSYNASWHPNGTTIVYTDARKDSGRLWLKSITTNSTTPLTSPSNF